MILFFFYFSVFMIKAYEFYIKNIHYEQEIETQKRPVNFLIPFIL